MFHLGIDISKDSFSAQLILDQSAESFLAKDFKSSKRGFNSLRVWLLKSGVVLSDLRVVMEATGVYWQKLAHFLIEHNITVAIVNPAQIKDFIKSYLRRGKTDSMDARMIALYSLERKPRPFTVPEPDLAELKLFVAERDHIVKLIAQERNRLHAHKHRKSCPKSLVRFINKRLRSLQSRLADIESLIKARINSSQNLSRIYKLLVSIPGIAFVTAIVLITQTNAFVNFVDSKQLAAYAGIAPAPNQSGKFRGHSRISKIGNARLRKALYLAALSASRFSPHFANFKARLDAEHKPKKVIFVAIARKLLVTAFAVVKSNRPFDPFYHSSDHSSHNPVLCS